jgi:hypothetical protein
MISERRIGKNVEGSGLGFILRHYSGIFLKGLRKTKKNIMVASLQPEI